MKTITVGTKEILDKALELETGSKLYIACSTEHERDILYYDLKRQRLWLIEDNLTKYEQVIIDRKPFNLHPNVILTKRNILSAHIMKTDGQIEEIRL